MTTIYTKKIWLLYTAIEIIILSITITLCLINDLRVLEIIQILVGVLLIPIFIVFEGRRFFLYRSIPKSDIIKEINNMKWFKVFMAIMFILILSVSLLAYIVEDSTVTFNSSFIFLFMMALNPKIIITKSHVYFSSWIIDKSEIASFKDLGKNAIKLTFHNNKTLQISHYMISDTSYEIVHIYKGSQELPCELS